MDCKIRCALQHPRKRGGRGGSAIGGYEKGGMEQGFQKIQEIFVDFFPAVVYDNIAKYGYRKSGIT